MTRTSVLCSAFALVQAFGQQTADNKKSPVPAFAKDASKTTKVAPVKAPAPAVSSTVKKDAKLTAAVPVHAPAKPPVVAAQPKPSAQTGVKTAAKPESSHVVAHNVGKTPTVASVAKTDAESKRRSAFPSEEHHVAARPIEPHRHEAKLTARVKPEPVHAPVIAHQIAPPALPAVVAPAVAPHIDWTSALSQQAAPSAAVRTRMLKIAPPDVSMVTVGQSRETVQSALGTPASKITMPEDGHLVEIYQYSSGTVRVDNGTVVDVRKN